MLTGYSALQISLQAINALTGFLLIRAMDKLDYAWFTIAFGSQTALCVLADCGLTSSLTTLGGPISREDSRLSALVDLIRQWRLRFMVTASAVIIPVTWWMLFHNSASHGESMAIIATVVLMGYAAIDSTVLLTANKLSNRLSNVFVAESLFGVVRLILVGVLFAYGGNAIMALVGTAVASLFQLAYLRYKTLQVRGISAKSDPAWNSVIRSQVLHVFPIGIWHCVQGQVSTTILTLFSTAHRIAEIGALSRFGFVFVIAMLPIGHFVLPSIARCTDRNRLKRLAATTLCAFAIVLFCIILLGSLGATFCLTILGPNYQHLEVEFAWLLGATAIATYGHAVWAVALTRGWVHYGWLEIPITIALQVIAAPMFDLSRITGAIGFVAVGSLVHLGVGLVLLVRGLRDHPAAKGVEAQ